MENQAETYERFKWTVLREAAYVHQSSIVYFWATRNVREQDRLQQDGLVRRVLLQLLDEGLIFFWWGGWDDGVDADLATVPHAQRAEVEAELSIPGSAPPNDQTVWFTTTEVGREKLNSLPGDVFLEA